MSDPYPPGGEPEYLGTDTPRTGPAARTAGRRPRSRWAVGAAALGLVGAAGAGWAAAQLLGGGDGPAAAVPSIAVGYVALDLDPTAAQKVEALRIAKKFPALAEELDLGVRDDLRRWFFEQAFGEGGCDLDYDRDVAPWIGDRMALAAVPDDDTAVAPLLVLQTSDRDAARAAVAAMDACAAAARDSVGAAGSDGPPAEPLPQRSAGVAFVGDYVLVTQEQDDVDAFAAAAEAAPLSQDPAFADWTEAAGGAGVLTMYASKDAPRVLTRAITEGRQELWGPMSDEMAERVRVLWRDFDGMAAVVRFADGALEVEVAGRGLPRRIGVAAGGDPGAAPALGDLPASTAVALTLPLADGWSEDLADGVVEMSSAGESEEEFWQQLEAGTGLRLPEDVETLLGDGLSLSVDSSLRREDVMGAAPGAVPRLPVALRISGDPDEIVRVLDRVLALGGPAAQEAVVVERTDGQVVVGLDPGYVDRVVSERDLADDPGFRAVVPEADRATGGLYVGFDAGGGWLERLVADDPEARAHLAPLDALGVSGWQEGDVQHGLLRLTTD